MAPWKVRATSAPVVGGMVADAAELRKGLELLADPDGFCQVVALPSARNSTLPGADLDGLCLAVEGMPQGFGVYLEVNPVREGLTAKARAADVTRRRWVYIDVDPVKAPEFKDHSATDAEKDGALATACEVLSHLETEYGWPAPAVVDSGNGFGLFYRSDLPNDRPTQDLLRHLLRKLAERFDGRASIDKSVHNADRLVKVPGTWAKKGVPSDDRPHRPCQVHYVPAEFVPLTADQIARAAGVDLEDKPPAPETNGRFTARATGSPDGSAAYGRRALDLECARVFTTPANAGRNNALNRAAFSLGQLVAGGVLMRQEVEGRLTEAARRSGLDDDPNCGERGIRGTIRSGLEAGLKEPRGVPGGAEKTTQKKADPPPAGKALTVNLSRVVPQQVEWLIKDRIPRGFITVFAGRTSVGKSFVAYDLIARLSKGGEIPCADGECFLPGGTLILGEDSPEFVIAPRLIKAGADRSRVHCMTWEAMGAFSLGDTDMLDRAVNEVEGGVSLVLIDPPTNFLGETDEHKNSQVRQLVMKVVEWAFKRDLSCLFILHVNKQTGKGVEALNRVMGSVAWVTTARIAHTFCPDPNDREQCLWAPLKNNLGKLAKPLAYRITQEADGQAVVEWVGEVDTTADEAMNATPRVRRDVAAAEWLVGKFRDRREWESEDLFKAAKQEGISRDAIFEAKKALNLPRARRQTQENGDVVYIWWVPDDWAPLSQPSGQSPGNRDSCDSTTVDAKSEHWQ